MRRCIDNREAELEEIVTRVVRAAGLTTAAPKVDPVDKIKALLLKQLDEHDYYAAFYALANPAQKTLAELKDRLLTERVKYTGWTPVWFPTRPEIAPRAVDEFTYECIHDGSGHAAHVEKWRASTKGEFTIIRAHDMDGQYPGKYISLVLPVWRIGELILHAGRMGNFFDSQNLEFSNLFTGLKCRELTTHYWAAEFVFEGHRTHAEEYRRSIALRTGEIDRQVGQFTNKLLRPFYHLFELDLPANLCEEEIQRMRSHRF